MRVESRLTVRAAFHLLVKHNFIHSFFYFVRSLGAYLKVEEIRKCENASLLPPACWYMDAAERCFCVPSDFSNQEQLQLL